MVVKFITDALDLLLKSNYAFITIAYWFYYNLVANCRVLNPIVTLYPNTCNTGSVKKQNSELHFFKYVFKQGKSM